MSCQPSATYVRAGNGVGTRRTGAGGGAQVPPPKKGAKHILPKNSRTLQGHMISRDYVKLSKITQEYYSRP